MLPGRHIFRCHGTRSGVTVRSRVSPARPCASAVLRIGAGLAKGEWSIVEAIIDEKLAGEDHTLVYES
jgi:hypothetical protein